MPSAPLCFAPSQPSPLSAFSLRQRVCTRCVYALCTRCVHALCTRCAHPFAESKKALKLLHLAFRTLQSSPSYWAYGLGLNPKPQTRSAPSNPLSILCKMHYGIFSSRRCKGVWRLDVGRKFELRTDANGLAGCYSFRVQDFSLQQSRAAVSDGRVGLGCRFFPGSG